MSGTRSTLKTVPATERPLLLVAAHGERGGAGDNARLASIAAKAGSLLPGWDVRHGVLSGSPSIEEALADADGRAVHIWPFFMCRGYFTDIVLLGRLEALELEHIMLDVLGETRAFAELALKKILEDEVFLSPDVLVIAHGSTKGTQSRLAAEQFAARLTTAGSLANVSCAFLEEPPFADDAIAALPEGSVVVSLFAGDGLHGGHDLDRILAASGRGDLKVVTPAADTEAVARIVAGAAFVPSDAPILTHGTGG